ncbi:MAG: maleylpyruvate isomerase family mycothiol-dependent enzyme [Acidimicrobiia bacterium]
MIDYVDVLRSESVRFSECAHNGDPQAAVPSCPDWNLADLTWHLGEVQYSWATIVGDLLLDDAGVSELSRPPDEDLPALFDVQSARLIDAVSRHPAEARCWTWDPNGWNVGWVRRRQAHEALIHRIDAELAIGHVTAVDEDLAADGVHELLFTHLDGVPDWATFIPDDTMATLSVDGGPSYGLRFGRIVGRGSQSGKDYDFDSFLVSEPAGTVISGTAVALDLWLWGRAESGVRCDDEPLLARIRSIVAEATQ